MARAVEGGVRVNPWRCYDPYFSGAIARTGRKNIIMGGVTTDIGLVFPSISAVQEGYNVLAVMNAGGSSYNIQEGMAQRRMIHGGVVLTTTNTMVAQLVQNRATPPGMQLDSITAWFGADDAAGQLDLFWRFHERRFKRARDCKFPE
jgi:hypothetical protein